jgi:hypothetical protein
MLVMSVPIADTDGLAVERRPAWTRSDAVQAVQARAALQVRRDRRRRQRHSRAAVRLDVLPLAVLSVPAQGLFGPVFVPQPEVVVGEGGSRLGQVVRRPWLVSLFHWPRSMEFKDDEALDISEDQLGRQPEAKAERAADEERRKSRPRLPLCPARVRLENPAVWLIVTWAGIIGPSCSASCRCATEASWWPGCQLPAEGGRRPPAGRP